MSPLVTCGIRFQVLRLIWMVSPFFIKFFFSFSFLLHPSHPTPPFYLYFSPSLSPSSSFSPTCNILSFVTHTLCFWPTTTPSSVTPTLLSISASSQHPHPYGNHDIIQIWLEKVRPAQGENKTPPQQREEAPMIDRFGDSHFVFFFFARLQVWLESNGDDSTMRRCRQNAAPSNEAIYWRSSLVAVVPQIVACNPFCVFFFLLFDLLFWFSLVGWINLVFFLLDLICCSCFILIQPISFVILPLHLQFIASLPTR